MLGLNILIVDDDQESRSSVANFLRELGHQVNECSDGTEALSAYSRDDYPMVLSDIKMSGMTGLELLRSISSQPGGNGTDVVLYTGYGNMETAVAALRAGAYDYLLKPINIVELAAITERIVEHQALRRENKRLTEQFDDELQAATKETQQQLSHLKKTAFQLAGLGQVGLFSEAMRRMAEQASKYHVERSIPVLIEGETGTGKEVIAKIIHFGNMDEIGPFVDINCAALTGSLFESELFGYEGGSFTGGLAKGQKGKLDLASGGTLFLDEIGEIPLELQGKLLRVIQEKEFYRVVGLKKIKTDVRLICATNVDLEKKVGEGSFRKDLYFRLKVGHLVIPPLRQRPEDILPLAKMFLDEFSTQRGKRFKHLHQQAARMLLEYPWPGNVRELRNSIDWVAFMHDDDELKPEHLGVLTMDKKDTVTKQSGIDGNCFPVINPDFFALPEERLPLEEYVDRIVHKSLELNQGNKTNTARYLGISRSSLYCRLKRLEETQ
ncbi:MAG: sigma-54-dependent transcriptional regulator [Bacillota bacterium]